MAAFASGERPSPRRLDGAMHGVGRQVDLAGSGDSSEFGIHLGEARRIGQGGEDARVGRPDPGTHIHHALGAVKKAYFETERR